MASLKSFLSRKKYVKIKLRRTATNHLELDATVNGVLGRFILDTGASNTCIGIDKTSQFDLNFEASNIKAAGAGATEMETMISTHNRIAIKDWVITGQQIVLFDLVHVNQALTAHQATAVDGIIGADILEKGKAVIDYKKKALYLKVIKS